MADQDDKGALHAAVRAQLKEAADKRASSVRAWAARKRGSKLCPIIGDPVQDWRTRHPDIARGERALRKERAEILQRWKHKNEGTPETHEHASRRNQGALARLYKNGTIDSEQLGAATEIAAVAERIASDVSVRTASLETRVDVTRIGDGGFFERLGQVRRELAYSEWRRELPHAAPVLDMIVGEPVGFTVIAKRYRMHNRRALQLLIAALDLWTDILGSVCKQVDDKELAAAHARLAA